MLLAFCPASSKIVLQGTNPLSSFVCETSTRSHSSLQSLFSRTNRRRNAFHVSRLYPVQAPQMVRRPSGDAPPPRDLFVPVLVVTAIVGYTLILAYDLVHSYGLL